MCCRTISVLALAALCASGCGPASWAADALLHPARRPIDRHPTASFDAVDFSGVDGVLLKGWRYPAAADRRGTIVVLHGIADNRTSSIGIADRFTRRGFDLIAYDSRAHGESGGDACTYGYYEKRDLRAVLDTVGARPIVVIGASLGAAVALQAAAEDDRIAAIVAAETFSDLETIARERAPSVLPEGTIRRAFAIAETRGRFKIDEVSPAAAASRIKVPVLLIHGADDLHTLPDHSRRVFAALAGPKELVLVPGAGHNRSLSGPVWTRIEQWLDRTVPPAPGHSARSATEGSTLNARRAGR
jgi:alpha-beta hydrolase superfamily lysophospholipase